MYGVYYSVYVFLMIVIFFFYVYGDHRDLHVLTHSFPTRRSSDLIRRGCDVPGTEHRIPLRLGIARSRLEGYGFHDIILDVPEERIVGHLLVGSIVRLAGREEKRCC